MRTTPSTPLSFALLALAACSSSAGGDSLTSTPGGANDPAILGGQSSGDPGPGGTPSIGGGNGANQNVAARAVDYGEALRTASLKLTGELPLLTDILTVGALQGDAQKQFYESQIDAMLSDPRFTLQMIRWWRNTLKTGNQGQDGSIDFDTAAVFAAQVVVTDRPYTDILTATKGTCPKFASGQFVPADCAGGAPTAGVLTDPGLMAQYFGNMAFRRVRFVQETFVCSKFPAEYSQSPAPMGSSIYTSPWPFSSVAGGKSAKINFQDTSAVICANCHTTMNHMAPLFAHFDESGKYDAAKITVNVPVVPPVTAEMGDWLAQGESLAWRDGKVVTDIPSLAQAIAADPDVARCAVTRVWDWAMSRGDVVLDLATVPQSVSDPFVKDFETSGMKLRKVIRDVFTSDDFVRF